MERYYGNKLGPRLVIGFPKGMCVYGIYCEFTCSPNQGLFINVILVHNNTTGDGIGLYITGTCGERLYNSIKDVECIVNTYMTESIVVVENFMEWYAVSSKE